MIVLKIMALLSLLASTYWCKDSLLSIVNFEADSQDYCEASLLLLAVLVFVTIYSY